MRLVAFFCCFLISCFQTSCLQLTVEKSCILVYFQLVLVLFLHQLSLADQEMLSCILAVSTSWCSSCFLTSLQHLTKRSILPVSTSWCSSCFSTSLQHLTKRRDAPAAGARAGAEARGLRRVSLQLQGHQLNFSLLCLKLSVREEGTDTAGILWLGKNRGKQM